MKSLLQFLFWSLVFVALLGVIDQFFVRVDLPLPGLTQTRHFYLDFRQRLLSEVVDGSPDPIGAAIDQGGRPASAPRDKSPRWVYADATGTLQFADSLEEVPARYRAEAQPLRQ